MEPLDAAIAFQRRMAENLEEDFVVDVSHGGGAIQEHAIPMRDDSQGFISALSLRLVICYDSLFSVHLPLIDRVDLP